MAEETAPVSETASTDDASMGETVGTKGYQVSTKELAEFGIDDTPDTGEIEFGKLSAEPKELKAAEESDDPEIKDILDALEVDDSDVKVDEKTKEKEEEPELELVRKGQTVKMKLSQAKDYAQKGFDYEVKSRELKGEREAFNHEKTEWSSKIEAVNEQFSTLKNEKEQIDALIEYVRETDPDTYAIFEAKAAEYKRTNHNPYMERMINDLKSEFSKAMGTVKQSSETEALKELNTEYFTQLSELKDVHNSKFAKYGIKLDESAIKKEWIESGKPLKKIYGELYGDKLLAVADSKRALVIKQKAAQSAPTMGKVKTAAKPSGELKGKLNKMSYSQIANEFIAGNLR